jgi:hypothetical protein
MYTQGFQTQTQQHYRNAGRQAGRQAQMTLEYEEKNLTECVFMGGERKGVG